MPYYYQVPPHEQLATHRYNIAYTTMTHLSPDNVHAATAQKGAKFPAGNVCIF